MPSEQTSEVLPQSDGGGAAEGAIDAENISSDGPSGIGGWLILPIIGLIVTAAISAYSLFELVDSIISPAVWRMMTDSTALGYHPLWIPLFAFEILGNLGLMLFAVVILRFFRLRSMRVPRLMIAWYVAVVGVQIVDLALSGQIPSVPVESDDIRSVGRSVTAAAIWIPYFLRSKRVRNTFTEPV